MSISLFALVLFEKPTSGNVAIIPINGPISATGEAMLGESGASATEIISFIEDANKDAQIQAIILEINSPGGSAVASDEIASAVKRTEKPTITLIREVGASGGYWIASATDHIVAHRMSITGSIGVISSYLEFSGLMNEYGVKYERLIAGKNKDLGTPFKTLEPTERAILEAKLAKIHDYFIQEIAQNRELPEEKVRSLATGEFYLGIEALEFGLIDEVGDITDVEKYLLDTQSIEEPEYVIYEHQAGLFDFFGSVINSFSYHLGQGITSKLFQTEAAIKI